MRSGGSRHMKWNERGHPSQHRKRPMPRHALQKSWLTISGPSGFLPLRGAAFAAAPTRAPTRRPRPLALTPERTWFSPPRVGRDAASARTRAATSRLPRPALGPTIVCTSAVTSDGAGSAKMLNAFGGALELARELAADDTSREGVPVGPVPSTYGEPVDGRPRRGRVAAIVSPIGLGVSVCSVWRGENDTVALGRKKRGGGGGGETG